MENEPVKLLLQWIMTSGKNKQRNKQTKKTSNSLVTVHLFYRHTGLCKSLKKDAICLIIAKWTDWDFEFD